MYWESWIKKEHFFQILKGTGGAIKGCDVTGSWIRFNKWRVKGRLLYTRKGKTWSYTGRGNKCGQITCNQATETLEYKPGCWFLSWMQRGLREEIHLKDWGSPKKAEFSSRQQHRKLAKFAACHPVKLAFKTATLSWIPACQVSDLPVLTTGWHNSLK